MGKKRKKKSPTFAFSVLTKGWRDGWPTKRLRVHWIDAPNREAAFAIYEQKRLDEWFEKKEMERMVNSR